MQEGKESEGGRLLMSVAEMKLKSAVERRKVADNEIKNLTDFFYNKMDLPTNDGLNNFLVSYIAKKYGSKVIISGVGGDELFFGYPTFKRIPRLNNILKFFPNSKLINNFFKYNIYPFLKKNIEWRKTNYRWRWFPINGFYKC